MAVENHPLEIYNTIWSLILNDPDFQTPMGITVEGSNQIKVTNGRVTAKRTVGTDADLPELEIRAAALSDEGNDGNEDADRPVFDLAEGGVVDDPHVVTYSFDSLLTYPTQNYAEFWPLLEVIRRNIRGNRLCRAGLRYVKNCTVEAEFERDAAFRQTVRPQHQITIAVEVNKN
jgi:hypothetical protein